jgi:hypothetical protein
MFRPEAGMTTDLWARVRRLFGKRMPSPNDANPQAKFRHPAHDRIQGKVNIQVASFVAVGTAGFLVGGAPGATAAVVVWTAVLIACWRLRAQALPGPAEQPQPSAYSDIEDVIDRLDDLARERNWDLAKRLDIARLACENRTMTFDELGDLYDRGLRSAPGRIRQDASAGPKNDVSG